MSNGIFFIMYSIEFGKEEFTKSAWDDYVRHPTRKVKTFHRVDGPALECIDGYKEYYLNGKYYSSMQEWSLAKDQVIELPKAPTKHSELGSAIIEGLQEVKEIYINKSKEEESPADFAKRLLRRKE